MITDKILTKEEVLKEGICFEDELDWGGEHYQQIVRYLDNGEEEPFTGLAYDLFPDGSLSFYGYIKEGYREGKVVRFYSNGKVMSNRYLISGSAHGLQLDFFDNGQLKLVSYAIMGGRVLYSEFDEEGNLVDQKLELTERDKMLAERFGVNLSDIRLDV